MSIQKFSVNNHPIEILLNWVKSNEIAIPEIQRPFVWDSTKVRDFIDSLYNGYPVGYIITWQNPTVQLKDGTSSKGKKILIDGQQRITALMAAILGKEVLNEDYKKIKIRIAFNPIDQSFEVLNSAIQKDKKWIPDISVVFSPEFSQLKYLREYLEKNPETDEEKILEAITRLIKILNIHIGIIELNSELDIEEVTEIFTRINSTGVRLSQADFAMSKIAVDEKFGGNMLRKAIDYFSHIAVKPEFYNDLIQNDKMFIETEYFNKMKWLKDDREDLYDPSYIDMLRVSFTSKFKRGKLQDLVALLSGRNFETKKYEETITEESFKLLKEGILDFMNETNFKRFVMIIRSAGFIDSFMITSQNALNFSYVLYLSLKDKNINSSLIETLVRKWFVLSLLRSRYTGSPDSQFDYDIKRLNESNPIEYIDRVIKSELSKDYWNFGLPEQLDTSNYNNPIFNVFLAAQVKKKDKGFLSKDITVQDLITLTGNIHHVYPKDYLKKLGYQKNMYNQVANYVIVQSEINKAISNKEPKKYLSEVKEQCKNGKPKYGGITDLDQLKENLKAHCIPLDLLENEMEYPEFLKERRKLMAEKIKKYFNLL
jgi:hypothetical protein